MDALSLPITVDKSELPKHILLTFNVSPFPLQFTSREEKSLMKSRILVQSKNTSRRLGSPEEAVGTSPSGAGVQQPGWLSSAHKQEHADRRSVESTLKVSHGRQNR